jgi:glycosyltransferase involved in cell wall biosynthesis
MPNDLPHITVIIPVFNDRTRLERCLESIKANAYGGPYDVIVADNGSVDGSADTAAAAGAKVLVMPGCRVAELRNACARTARGDILAFVDADHTLDPMWLATAAAMFDAPDIGAVGAPYLPPANTNWVQRSYDRMRRRDDMRQDVDWLPSGNLLVRRPVFHQVGGFDTTLETCEDVDFCNRVRHASYRVVSDLRLRSTHFGDPATLEAVFLGELWRGRDNVRVTLRPPLRLNSLCSLMIASAGLVCLMLVALGGIAVSFVGPRPLLAGAAGFVFLSILRATRMTRSGGAWISPEFGPNLVVASAYDLGRAVALLARASHRTRQIGNRT